MNPQEAIKLARPRINNFVGGWPKGYIYDQNDPNRIRVDRALCTGCVAGTIYEAMTGRTGIYDTMFYEAAKKNIENHPQEDGGGIRFTLQAALEYYRDRHQYGNEAFGSYFRLVNRAQVLAWLITVGPVAMGIHMRDGIAAPRPKHWWSFFGPRWATYDGEFSKSKHAMTITGVSVPGEYFRIQNSWGRLWGNKGTARLSFDDFERILSGRSVFYGMTFDPQD